LVFCYVPVYVSESGSRNVSVLSYMRLENVTRRFLCVVVVILAEDRSIQEKLLYYDLKVQTIAQVAPIQLYAASVLSSLFAHLGWYLCFVSVEI